MKKVGRNDLCPCGSGKKFKKCHMGMEDELGLDGVGEVSVEEFAAANAVATLFDCFYVDLEGFGFS